MAQKTNAELAELLKIGMSFYHGNALFFDKLAITACPTGCMLIAENNGDFAKSQKEFYELQAALDVFHPHDKHLAAHLAMAKLLDASLLTIMAVSCLHTFSRPEGGMITPSEILERLETNTLETPSLLTDALKISGLFNSVSAASQISLEEFNIVELAKMFPVRQKRDF